MKHRNEIYAAIVCSFLLCAVLLFIVWMRCGLHDGQALEAEERTAIIAEIEKGYKKQLSALEAELEAERQVNHVEIEYVYTPLPVDYENIGDIQPDETDAVLLAKTLWGEYRDSKNYAQCAAVCWCILNRVDAEGFGDTVKEVVTAPYQFQGYSARNPVDAELYNIAVDVLLRWQCEDRCYGDIGRVIGEDYLWFEATPGMVNVFRNAYRGGEHITP